MHRAVRRVPCAVCESRGPCPDRDRCPRERGKGHRPEQMAVINRLGSQISSRVFGVFPPCRLRRKLAARSPWGWPSHQCRLSIRRAGAMPRPPLHSLGRHAEVCACLWTRSKGRPSQRRIPVDCRARASSLPHVSPDFRWETTWIARSPALCARFRLSWISGSFSERSKMMSDDFELCSAGCDRIQVEDSSKNAFWVSRDHTNG
jgi:hypothetical protein